MFGLRTLTAPEALRYYADTRSHATLVVRDYLFLARTYFYYARRYYARTAISRAQERITLLEFMLSHVNELPTDEATIEVLRQDLADMKNAVDTADMYLAHPGTSFPK